MHTDVTDDVVAMMDAAQAQALALGLTGVHDLDGPTALAAWQVLRARGRLRLRVWKSVPGALLAQASELGLRTGLGDPWLRLGGVKLFADGRSGHAKVRLSVLLLYFHRESE